MTFRILIFLSCFSSILAAQELNVPEAYDIGVKAMDNGQYDVGLAAVDKVITKHGTTGKSDYGSVFGHFYYLKGMLLIKKKDYKQAIENFKICHEQFPNGEDSGGLPNCFLAEALAQWGGCLMALQDYNGATAKYRAALAVVEQHDPKMNRLEAQVNLSKCMMLAGNSGQGKNFVSKNLDDPNVPDDMKRSFFLILVGDWSPGAPLTEVNTYLEKYRALMNGDTLVDRYMKQNPVYNRLASEAIEANDPDRALIWYNEMINPVEVGKAYAGRIDQLKKQVSAARTTTGSGEFISKAQKEITALEAEMENQRKQLGEILLGKGSAYYAKGTLNEARESYLELASRFPGHPERPLILHNLTMCSLNLAQWDEAIQYGMDFFRKYPDHELRNSMAKVLVDALFVQGKYDEAYRVATRLEDSFPEGTPEAEVPAFIAAASLYHLTRFDEAENKLNNYLKKYPDGTRVESAGFYLGASKVNLQKWDEAMAYFDSYLERHEESEMRASALYFSGLSHLVGKNYPLANSRMIELQVKHPRAQEIPSSFNVLGDILSAREKPYQEITDCYQKALAMVEQQNRGDIDVAGYSLRQLMIEANAARKWDIAVGYYEQFSRKYAKSTWRSDVLIAAIEPLVETGRKNDAEKLLIDFVNEYAAQPNSPELDQMFMTYSDFLNQHYKVEEVRQHLQSFPAQSSPPSPPLQAWIHLAEIEALTGADPEKYSKEIAESFQKLNALYQDKGTELSNYALVKLARYNGQNGGNPEQARKVYQYIIKERPSGEAMGLALVDLAKLEAGKNDSTSQSAAKDLFQRVLNEVDDVRVHEEAVLGIARIETRAKNYGAAQKWWKQYRSTPAWRKFRPEASYQYGVCLREQGKLDEAAATFVNVYSNFPGHLDWSTGAYIDAAKIIKSKGQELDALKLLREMIQRMGHLEHPGVAEGRKLFHSWRDDYIAKQKK